MNTYAETQAIQYSIYRKMTPDQKIRIATGLYIIAREIKQAALQAKYPHLSDIEIQKKLRDIFLHART